MRAALLAAVVVVWAACGGNASGDQPDSNPACTEWTVAAVAVNGLRLIDPAAISLGRSIRLALEIDLTACDEIGMITTVVGVGELTGTVEAAVLTQVVGTCTGTAQTVTRITEYQPREVGDWTLTAGTATVNFTVGAEPVLTCDASRSPCEVDCDCDEGNGVRCVGVTLGTPTTVCAKSCEVDRDCGGTRCSGSAAGPGGVPYSCDAEPECDGTRLCPTGFTCATGVCTPSFMLGMATRHECMCDVECDPGLRCVRPTDPQEPSRCQAMCPTGGPWCEGAHVCGAAILDVAGLAGTGSVCGWQGE